MYVPIINLHEDVFPAKQLRITAIRIANHSIH
jgi:hypothetical protein